MSSSCSGFDIFAVFIIFSLAFVHAVISSLCEPNYSTNALKLEDIRQVAFGYVKTLLSNNENYLLHQEVQFWCIKPGEKIFRQIFIDKPSGNILDKRIPISFVVHGYMGSIENSPWMDRIARNWAIFGNRNVCQVDWKRLASYSYYTTSQKHTQIVGFYMAEFIQSLQIQINETSIAGHSLGAQVAGYCGRALNGSLNVIYGLDPAGPLFTFPLSVNTGQMLDSNDAHHVQCLHTDRGILGTLFRCGNSDFYANFGFRQPGCTLDICNHVRAVYIFEASLNRSNSFVGKDCHNDIRALLNRCSTKIDKFGIHGNHINGRFYFSTTECYPYCLGCTR